MSSTEYGIEVPCTEAANSSKDTWINSIVAPFKKKEIKSPEERVEDALSNIEFPWDREQRIKNTWVNRLKRMFDKEPQDAMDDYYSDILAGLDIFEQKFAKVTEPVVPDVKKKVKKTVVWFDDQYKNSPHGPVSSLQMFDVETSII